MQMVLIQLSAKRQRYWKRAKDSNSSLWRLSDEEIKNMITELIKKYKKVVDTKTGLIVFIQLRKS